MNRKQQNLQMSCNMCCISTPFIIGFLFYFTIMDIAGFLSFYKVCILILIS